MLNLSPPVIPAAAVGAAKAYLRIEQDAEDALIADLLAAALRHAEAFTNITILRRSGVERLGASADWQRLGATPVLAITHVEGVLPDGTRAALPVGAYALDIDGSGDGWFRITEPVAARQVEVTVEAGLASGWAEIAEPLRLAILRLFGHLHTVRDDPADIGPPAAVAAILRPWRRLRLA